MNDENQEFDPNLEALFRREHTHLPAEPFSTATVSAIAAARRRALLGKRALQAAGVAALILLSPRLIDASIWISARLDELLATVSAWLSSPLGLAAAVLCALGAAAAARWARIW